MSIAIGYAGILATLASLFILLLLRKRQPKNKPLGCLCAVIAFPILFCPLVPMIGTMGTSRGFDLTLTEVKASWLGLQLPNDASHITFYQHFNQDCSVDFSIGENDFLAWCQENYWIAEPIKTCTLVRTLDKSSSETGRHEVVEGYRAIVFPESKEGGAYVVFDKLTGRAFYRWYTN